MQRQHLHPYKTNQIPIRYRSDTDQIPIKPPSNTSVDIIPITFRNNSDQIPIKYRSNTYTDKVAQITIKLPIKYR
jgi:hypothetical protein